MFYWPRRDYALRSMNKNTNSRFAWLLVLLTVLFVSSANAAHDIHLTNEERQFIADHPVITLGSDRTWEPYIIVNQAGEISGYDSEILAHINEVTGANFVIKVGSWSDMQEQAKTHVIDGLTTGAAIEKRKSYLNFSEPYLTLRKSVFVSLGNHLNIQSPQDLAGKRIGIQKGNLADLETAKQFPDSEVVYFDTVEALLSSISTGNADAIFGNGATLYLANKLGMPYLQVGFHLQQQLDLVFGVRKDWPLAISILNKALISIPTHEKIRIQTKWFSSVPTDTDIPRLSDQEKRLIKSKQSIRYCIDPNWLPFEGLDSQDKHTGLTADLIRIFSERLGVNFIFHETQTWSDTLKALQDRQCDLVTGIEPTTERSEYLNFTHTVYSTPLVLATRPDQFFITDLHVLSREPIAMVKGTAGIKMVREQYPNLRIIEVASIKEGLQHLSDKKVFGYIDSLEVIAHHVTELNYLNIKVSSTLPLKYHLAFGIRSDWPEWVSVFDKTIKTINEKQFSEIYNSWVAIKFQQGFDYRFLTMILAIVGILVAFILYRYRVTTRYNQKLSQLNQKLELLATTDQLTQVPNRYRLNLDIQRTLISARRFEEDLCMILFDIDHFKEINDHYGHQVGDKVLITVSQTMQTMIREVDILGRWGGEEFLLICPKTDLLGACKLANKIRTQIQYLKLEEGTSVTLSAGVAQFDLKEDFEHLLKRLDDALYFAKNSGRNQVIEAKGNKKPQ